MYTGLYSKMAYAHWPLAPVANGHWPLLLYKSYTCYTRWVKAFQQLYSYTVYSRIQRIQLYIAIHYTPSTSPLCPPRPRLLGRAAHEAVRGVGARRARDTLQLGWHVLHAPRRAAAAGNRRRAAGGVKLLFAAEGDRLELAHLLGDGDLDGQPLHRARL